MTFTSGRYSWLNIQSSKHLTFHPTWRLNSRAFCAPPAIHAEGSAATYNYVSGDVEHAATYKGMCEKFELSPKCSEMQENSSSGSPYLCGGNSLCF